MEEKKSSVVIARGKKNGIIMKTYFKGFLKLCRFDFDDSSMLFENIGHASVPLKSVAIYFYFHVGKSSVIRQKEHVPHHLFIISMGEQFL